MVTLAWEDIKEFYKEHFGISNWVVEMLANLDILTLCASGASNNSISVFLDIPEDEIALVIKEVFDFAGWEVDLPINPYKIFKGFMDEEYMHKRSDTISVYLVELGRHSGFESIRGEDLFKICEILESIEERIYDEWI